MVEAIAEHNATGTAMHLGNQDFGGLGPNDGYSILVLHFINTSILVVHFINTFH
jgi:hypothetical protein